MKTAVFFVLTVALTGCRCTPVETFDIADNADIGETTDIADITDITDFDPEEEVAPHSGLQWGSSKIAFMAYLTGSKMYGNNQHVKFNKVPLNDGNGYKASTGVFRAPRSGVYTFTFTIAIKCCKCEVRVRLMVDGKPLAGAVAEGRHCGQDVMGGNTAVAHICKGQSVWVETMSGCLLAGSSKYLYTTFSGHLLYKQKCVF